MSEEKIEKENLLAVRKHLTSLCLEDNINARTYATLFRYNLTKRVDFVNDPISIIKILKSEIDSSCDLKGPYIFTNDGEEKPVAISISDLLLDINVNIRKATIDYLLDKSFSKILSPNAISITKEVKSDIQSESKDIWVPSAIKIADALSEDWLFHYHGIIQSIEMNFDDGSIECLTRTMRPKIGSVEKIDNSVISPSLCHAEIIEDINAIIKKSKTLLDALNLYIEKYGHIPLAKKLSVCTLYDKWIANRVKASIPA